MNIEHLLHAGLELEKRIAHDQALRHCFLQLWKNSDQRHSAKNGKATEPNGFREIKLKLPAEVYELIEATAKLTGKSPAVVIEESFALYWETHVKKLG